MKSIFIISINKIYQGNTPGAARLMNIAKALALGKNKVFLCSAALNNRIIVKNLKEISQDIFLVGEEEKANNDGFIKNIFCRVGYILLVTKYLIRINSLLKQIEGEKVIYLYPQPQLSMDIMCLIIFKFFNNYRIYYDVNELRRAALDNILFSTNLFKRVIEHYFYYVNRFKYILAERLTKYYDGLVVISTSIEKYFRIYNNNLLRIPILSDASERLFSKAPVFKKGNKFTICFTGWISLKKEGFDLLFEAISQVKSIFKDIELHLYGPISKKEKTLILNEIPIRLDIKKNIIYHGFVARENIIKEMQKYHLLILPRPSNLTSEYGFSTKLSEYLISGIPVLVTDVSDNALFIKEGFNGFVVKPGDIDEMAEKILNIISNYNEVANTMVKNAYNTAKQNFHYANYSNQLTDFLK